MTPLRIELAAALMEIEYQLRRLQLWSDVAPSETALASQQPFAIDTLAFEQWLQFIFLPRMRDLIESEAQLPASCAIAPMGEHIFGQEAAYEPLLSALRELDRHFA